MIRNEELLLLRAEANIGLNDLGAALIDINTVRAGSGLLANHAAFASKDEAIAELLYNPEVLPALGAGRDLGGCAPLRAAQHDSNPAGFREQHAPGPQLRDQPRAD